MDITINKLLYGSDDSIPHFSAGGVSKTKAESGDPTLAYETVILVSWVSRNM